MVPDFALPDLAPLPEGEFTRRTQIETEVRVGDETLPCRVTIERYRDDGRERGPHDMAQQLAQLHVEFDDPETKERLAVFKGALNEGFDVFPKKISPDGKPHRFWTVFTRRVEKEARGRGVGGAGVAAFERIAERMAAAEPELDAEWMQVDTHLESMSRLIVSQRWLEEQGLQGLKKRSGPDFGYVPYPPDAVALKRVLQSETEELADVGAGMPEVRLYKKMKP